MRFIKINGKRKGTLIVDDEDYLKCKSKSLHISKRGYVSYGVYDPFTKGTYVILLHRVLAKAKRGERIDHRNRNKLDCRKRNLRRASAWQNMCNRGLQSNNRTGYRGVVKRGDSYLVYFKHRGKCNYLGSFKSAEIAAKIWNKEASAKRGEFAVLNVL